MLNLRAATKDILSRVEKLTGKSVQLMRDDSLSLLATLNMARDGAAYHVLRYKPTDEPLDYVVAYQAAFLLRLFENKPEDRFDFVQNDSAVSSAQALIKGSHFLSDKDAQLLPGFAQTVAQWALSNLRSYAVGMRIDTWLYNEFESLREMQAQNLFLQQQQNLDLLSFQLGGMTIPSVLMGPLAAYALFVDRLFSTNYSVAYEAAGVLKLGEGLLEAIDELPPEPEHDQDLIGDWASQMKMSNWFHWEPYRP